MRVSVLFWTLRLLPENRSSEDRLRQSGVEAKYVAEKEGNAHARDVSPLKERTAEPCRPPRGEADSAIRPDPSLGPPDGSWRGIASA